MPTRESSAGAGWWTPAVSDEDVPDADLLYPDAPAGSASQAALVYSASSAGYESASEMTGPYIGRFGPAEAGSARAVEVIRLNRGVNIQEEPEF